MKRTRTKRRILLFLGVFSLTLTACYDSTFDKLLSTNMKWVSEDGKFIMLAQGIQGYCNYCRIEIDGIFETEIYEIYNSNINIYSKDYITSGLLSANMKRIPDQGFFRYREDKLKVKFVLNRTSDPYWDNWEGILNGTPLEESELNAKYFCGTTFENIDLSLIFGFKTYEESAFTYKLFGYYGETSIEFSFGDNYEFSITSSDLLTANGTYTSRYDGMDLTFSQNDIFDIEGNTIALTSTNTQINFDE
jgi:hypothetical protein